MTDDRRWFANPEGPEMREDHLKAKKSQLGYNRVDNILVGSSVARNQGQEIRIALALRNTVETDHVSAEAGAMLEQLFSMPM
jgi:hypothetical protein